MGGISAQMQRKRQQQTEKNASKYWDLPATETCSNEMKYTSHEHMPIKRLKFIEGAFCNLLYAPQFFFVWTLRQSPVQWGSLWHSHSPFQIRDYLFLFAALMSALYILAKSLVIPFIENKKNVAFVWLGFVFKSKIITYEPKMLSTQWTNNEFLMRRLDGYLNGVHVSLSGDHNTLYIYSAWDSIQFIVWREQMVNDFHNV